MNVKDTFSLYVLFSQSRPRDVLKGIYLWSFHKLCIHMHASGEDENWKLPRFYGGNLTRSEMGNKSFMQAKKVC